ncbi:MAG: hypothetical protein UV63_C0042G0003 [Microgenomates group bacterium GW2011_GWC1_43_11]|uniref:Uncharacterized protein n=2 Tax=Candidatus Gottesmaniibacteriota TaxID=1752720 RepID=A0A0G1IIG6_9BACT|nr:MAG: hypothetical protein UV63_C0042G0003 [Microgenomates group bacterium GW2011_GWC1_43_11]KKT37944.1 MAG: hypothetical protein UW22_C0016G0007 [Candidatus Gottesmanbacteria bacterium GW2011_GWB1_44_11c]KKT58985.1 MAG: hypothetical protein UW52_C0053G0002 [Candidatus Gottesmanbacteria bacterium GW2011_GWA1_44_24b]HCM81840.1 hypothetical protein [Patescibacteria group bacterium]
MCPVAFEIDGNLPTVVSFIKDVNLVVYDKNKQQGALSLHSEALGGTARASTIVEGEECSNAIPIQPGKKIPFVGYNRDGIPIKIVVSGLTPLDTLALEDLLLESDELDQSGVMPLSFDKKWDVS